jgi:hypothetical protein
MEGPGKQYPYETTGGLEPGRFKPIEEPGAEEKDPVVFTGLETVWVTVDKVGIPTLGLVGVNPFAYWPHQFLSVRIPLGLRLLVVSLTLLLSYRIQS